MKRPARPARDAVLEAALRAFAAKGYAGTSVQDIVGRSRFSKPTLYYYFGSKAGLFQALVEQAYDDCHDRMKNAAASQSTPRSQLIEVITALFEFLRDRKDLMRITFGTAFAAKGEIPAGLRLQEKRRRNFDLIDRIIRAGQSNGCLSRSFKRRALTQGIYGALVFHLLAPILLPNIALNRATAEQIVDLFLKGAGAGKAHS